jgi:hypothetical protein
MHDMSLHLKSKQNFDQVASLLFMYKMLSIILENLAQLMVYRRSGVLRIESHDLVEKEDCP